MSLCSDPVTCLTPQGGRLSPWVLGTCHELNFAYLFGLYVWKGSVLLFALGAQLATYVLG